MTNSKSPEVTIETFTKLDGTKQEIRAITIDDKPWFVAVDVCRAIGLDGTASSHIRRLNPDERRGVKRKHTFKWQTREFPGPKARQIARDFIAHPLFDHLDNRVHTLVTISESGLYKLIMRCDKPNARPFQDWVTRVALPTLRTEGVYVRDEEKVADASSVEDLDSLNDMIVGLMKRKTELLEARLAEKEAIIQKQAPKVSADTDVWQLRLIYTHLGYRINVSQSAQPWKNEASSWRRVRVFHKRRTDK